MEDILPAFTPDGARLVFARRYQTITQWTPGRQIWLLSIKGDGSLDKVYPLTDDPYYNHYDFDWSPSGDRLVYVRSNQINLTDPPEIWILEVNSKQHRHLAVGGFAPQWLP